MVIVVKRPKKKAFPLTRRILSAVPRFIRRARPTEPSVFGLTVSPEIKRRIGRAGKEFVGRKLEEERVARETLTQKEQIVRQAKRTGKVLAFIPRELAAGLSVIGKSFLEGVGFDPNQSTPELEKKLFGRETGTLQQLSKEAGELVEEAGGSETEKKIAITAAFIGGFFLESPVGLPKSFKPVATALIKELTEEGIEKILKKEFKELPDEFLAKVRGPLAAAKTEKDIEKILRGDIPTAPVRATAPELEPLAQEARKFKTAEEFVEAQELKAKAPQKLPPEFFELKKIPDLIEEGQRTLRTGKKVDGKSVTESERVIVRQEIKDRKELLLKNRFITREDALRLSKEEFVELAEKRELVLLSKVGFSNLFEQTNQVIEKMVGSRKPQDIIDFYIKKYPALKGLSFESTGVGKSPFADITVGRGLVKGKDGLFTFDAGFDWSKVKIRAQSDAPPGMIRHEIEHALDILFTKPSKEFTAFTQFRGLKTDTFNRFLHKNFQYEFLYKQLRKEKPLTKSQLTDIFNQAKGVVPEKPPVRAVPKIRVKRIPKISPEDEIAQLSKELSLVGDLNTLKRDVTKSTILSREGDKVINLRDPTGTAKDRAFPIKKTPDTITTRNFKQKDEWKEFARYAEDNLQARDISPAFLFRHVTLTMERVAEFLDGGLGGRTYRTIVKPVFDSAKKMTIEGNRIRNEVNAFNVLEGSTIDKQASLFAQRKLPTEEIVKMPQKARDLAKYTREKYDEFIDRLNVERAKVGTEPLKKRRDYITHINELNTLSELFGGFERISIERHISILKSRLLDEHPDWNPERAFDAAKRKVEGLQGVAQYVDARQPAFKFAKQRLIEHEADPSIIRSFNAYMPSALRYIHQAENVARNKAFKDVLPANAREFTRLWNTEQVAGRQPPSFLSPKMRRAVSALRGTLGANTILGNMATTIMQLTSFAQVFSSAGVLNTFIGIGKRLRSYIPGQHTLFETSRTKALRNLDIDIGLGDSLIDSLLITMGKHEILRDPSARTRQAVDVGRKFLRAIMETADQFTVGATYEAFHRKALNDGLSIDDAMEFAEIMTGKTQANYFKEALPPFLNTIEGKSLAQFGTYGMNQFEFFKKDFGKQFNFNEKSERSVKIFFKQFLVFLTSAYIIDSMSEETFGRQPYDVKALVDASVGFAKGEITAGQLANTATETVATYLPFMGNAKFNTMPPVFEFGKDVSIAVLGSGKAQEEAITNLGKKWSTNILLPYGANQVRKTVSGVEAGLDIDLPFVKNRAEGKFDIEGNIEIAKALLFNPYATQGSREFFENRDRRESLKNKFEITGSVTSDENIAKYKQMTREEFRIYTDQYVDKTKETINKKMGKGRGISVSRGGGIQVKRKTKIQVERRGGIQITR